MKKLEMAHEYLLAVVTEIGCTDFDIDATVSNCWKLADAMQAEADKRNKSEAEEKRKYMRELLNADNTFIEKEGQHFDDVEWQPDWSQAPDWAVAYTVDKNDSLWWSEIPEMHMNIWFIDGGVWECSSAPSFGYNGHWQDSLRKRHE